MPKQTKRKPQGKAGSRSKGVELSDLQAPKGGAVKGGSNLYLDAVSGQLNSKVTIKFSGGT